MSMSATVTMEFREEYEAERTRWLRKRFLWYSGVLGGYAILQLPFALIGLFVTWSGAGFELRAIDLTAAVIQSAAFVSAFMFVYRHPQPLDALLRLVFWLIVLTGGIAMITSPLAVRVSPQVAESSDRVLAAFGSLFLAFLAHFLASLFIPWTPREAMKPLGPLVAIYAVATLFIGGGGLFWRVGMILLSPLIGLPGIAIAWWREGRFKDRFTYHMLRGRYGRLRKDLTDARRIHEALFPPQIEHGPVRLRYRYEPMHHIGGDFLYATLEERFDDRPGRLSVVVMDVTGHGVAAALTVNRLHGELERLFAEKPDISPGEVLTCLNRYVNLTLAKHSVYATALCLRADPAGDLIEWASAGHPPAFLRDAAARIERLEATTIMLGAWNPDEFDGSQRSMRFGPGDVVLAYTDGAIEARNQEGRMLKIEGMERVIASCRPGGGPLTDAVVRAVDQYRFSSRADDTLVVELSRPLETPAPARIAAAPVAAAGAAAGRDLTSRD
jgi:serine phosphatase RsbU (regulator of sigma subunit)